MTVDLGRLSIALGVKDVAKSADFYGRLGFEPIEEDDWNRGYAVFRYGHLTLQLMDFIPQQVLFNLRVDETALVASAMARLDEDGIDVRPAGKDDTGAYWVDPDGNAFYLFAEDSASPS